MAKTSDCVIPALSRRLEYFPRSGELVWLPLAGDCRETHRWNSRYAGTRAGSVNTEGYILICFTLDGRRYKVPAHRVAWYCLTGQTPSYCIDHIDGDPRNNRAVNLRDVPAAVNARNAKHRARNTSGVTGVCWNKRQRKWVAQAKENGKHRHLGVFSNKADAITAAVGFRAATGFSGRCYREEVTYQSTHDGVIYQVVKAPDGSKSKIVVNRGSSSHE